MAGSGRFDPSVLRTLVRNELRMLLRDRRTLLIAVVAPLVLFPAIIFLMRTVEEGNRERRSDATFEYAVLGDAAAFAREAVSDALALPPDSGRAETNDLADRFTHRPVDAGAAGASAPASAMDGMATSLADSLLAAGELQLIVEGITAERYRSERRERRDEGGAPLDAADEDDPRVPVIRLHYREDSERSSTAADLLAERLRKLREQRRDDALADRAFPVAPAAIARVDRRNVASAEKEAGALLGLFLTPLLVMLMLAGGSVVAVDAIAGEKERGTLENLLTTAARRAEIVASKQLAVITVGVAVTLVNVANLLLYLQVGLIELPENLAVAVGPGTLIVLLALFLPLAVLVSSVLLLVSGYAKSYKEYQIYFFPVFVLLLLPSIAAVLPALELRSLVALLPIANVSVAVREVLTGRFDWPFLGVAVAATTAAAVWLARLTSRALSTERLITAAELDRADLVGGPALFERRVLRWFAVLWAILLGASLWMGDVGIRGQVAVNLLGLFLGGSILMIRRYRLNPRDALALRRPHPAVWPAVLLGAPCALVLGMGFAELADIVIPVPDRMVEAFGQFLLPESTPIGEVLLLLCILPGICEEIAFRGVLLHGLRRKLSPLILALAVGAIFGLFHVSLFRILPTGYLGAVLAAVVLLTGSIYPAMVWHALNNAAVLVPAYYGWWTGETPPALAYPAAAVGLALAFFILWRTRRPYPGLRGWPATPARAATRARAGAVPARRG